MNSEITALEAKIEQVVALVLALRAENAELKAQVATLDGECGQLRQTMAAARERLEGLMAKLPEEA